MVRKGLTIPELRWPSTPEFSILADAWNKDASIILLGYIWQAYDSLQKEVLTLIDCDRADEELERSITQLLEPLIHKTMTGYEPFYVQHGAYENETRQPSPAQPPEYDIAFVLTANPRIMWPLEAKVLRTAGRIAAYVKDVLNEFLTCRYAPFSKEAGMLGYLFGGDPDQAFEHIARELKCRLHNHAAFAGRPHMTSDHNRNVRKNKSYPREFRCHHLILKIKNNTFSENK